MQPISPTRPLNRQNWAVRACLSTSAVLLGVAIPVRAHDTSPDGRTVPALAFNDLQCQSVTGVCAAQFYSSCGGDVNFINRTCVPGETGCN
jgi:hypothetical protein